MNNTTIIKAIENVTAPWKKQRKAEQRDRSRRANRMGRLSQSSWTVTVKEVAYEVMEAAYMKASGGGKLPALARQIMYAARGPILARADKDSFKDAYFTQTLLPDFITDHPTLTAGWDVVYDARGHLIEPHTNCEVKLGTIDVRRYIGSWSGASKDDGVSDFDTDYPTRGPEHRYGAVLFIEKEGFMPLFKATHLAERYDIAIMFTKGMSNTASRSLVDDLCGQDVPLLVVRDFDQAGFSIVATLTTSSRRYRFRNHVRVIDLGLRLEDVEGYELESEPVSYHRSNPKQNLLHNGATLKEIDFLCHPDSGYPYAGQRVELNAFTSDQMIEWLEAKLEEHQIRKMIPDSVVLDGAYRRATQLHYLNRKMREAEKDAKAKADEVVVPDDLTKQIEEKLDEDPSLPWDDVLAEIAAEAK